MALTKVEREKISDSVLKIQSVSRSLQAFDESKIPEFKEIVSCLHSAHLNLRLALRIASVEKNL